MSASKQSAGWAEPEREIGAVSWRSKSRLCVYWSAFPSSCPHENISQIRHRQHLAGNMLLRIRLRCPGLFSDDNMVGLFFLEHDNQTTVIQAMSPVWWNIHFMRPGTSSVVVMNHHSKLLSDLGGTLNLAIHFMASALWVLWP